MLNLQLDSKALLVFLGGGSIEVISSQVEFQNGWKCNGGEWAGGYVSGKHSPLQVWRSAVRLR